MGEVKGVIVDVYGVNTVDLHNVGYKDDQWVLASRVMQVSYHVMPKENDNKSNQHAVVSGK